tara:strand:- start:32 stop:430 length:399 start_codon:yes stop_codon:yes gene_type:complete
MKKILLLMLLIISIGTHAQETEYVIDHMKVGMNNDWHEQDVFIQIYPGREITVQYGQDSPLVFNLIGSTPWMNDEEGAYRQHMIDNGDIFEVSYFKKANRYELYWQPLDKRLLPVHFDVETLIEDNGFSWSR